MKSSTVSRRRVWFAAPFVAIFAVACQAPVDEPAAPGSEPAAEDTPLTEQAILYSTNVDGTWSADAKPIEFMGSYQSGQWIYGTFRGKAVFSGPSGKTRKMGICVLQRVGGSTGQSCSTIGDCPAPPVGGSMYCVNPNNQYSGKTCYVRPGSQSGYCGGSPALGGAAIAPGTVNTPTLTAYDGTYWLSYACFEGCSATDPSSSSLGWMYAPQFDPCGGGPMCGSQCC